MKFDYLLIVHSLPVLVAGAGVTIKITILSVGIGLVIGAMVALGRLAQGRLIKIVTTVYVDCIRGTPLLVQLFIIYFALPTVVGQRINPFVAAISACSINCGAYIAEIFRAGIQSIDKGQFEAGRSLGMNWTQTMRHVILPQALKRIIPPLGNEFIAMLKDSSLVSVIGFSELTREGQLIIARTYGSFEIWLTVAFIYLVMTFVISRLVDYWERRWKIGDQH